MWTALGFLLILLWSRKTDLTQQRFPQVFASLHLRTHTRGREQGARSWKKQDSWRPPKLNAFYHWNPTRADFSCCQTELSLSNSKRIGAKQTKPTSKTCQLRRLRTFTSSYPWPRLDAAGVKKPNPIQAIFSKKTRLRGKEATTLNVFTEEYVLQSPLQGVRSQTMPSLHPAFFKFPVGFFIHFAFSN